MKRKTWHRRTAHVSTALALSLAPVALLPVPHAAAQTAGTASLQGTVKDPTGAAIPGAQVTLTSTETGTTRQTVADAAGIFSIPNVAVGPYSISVKAAGFATFVQQGVLEVGQNVQVAAALTIGAESTQVLVEADNTNLDTESSSFKQVIDEKRITELPLNGRIATQLILVAGGAVTAPTGDLVGSKTYATSVVINVAGTQGDYNNYELDGGSHTDTFTNTNLPFPFPDALREFSVESNSLQARNGLHPGALVNAVTVSGTNQWHGSAFDFIRNNIINANNFFSTQKDTLKRNQFGGTLGGHLIKDKLFFFGGFQGTINRQVNNATGYCVPTAAELAGNFSQMGGNCPVDNTNIMDPISGANISATRMLTSPSEISQQALNVVKMLPTALADQYGYIKIALPANYSEQQYVGRVDYTFNPKHSLFGRYYITNYKAPAYYSPTNLLLTTTAGNDERVQSFTLGDTYLLTANLVNSFHGTYARRRDTRGPTAGGINSTNVGVQIYDYVPADFRLTVTNGFSIGCGTCSPGFFNTNTEDFVDDVDYLRGKHEIAFGGEIIRTGDNTQAGYLQNGNYTFGGLNSGVGGKTGEGMIDFLTGRMSNAGTTYAFSQSRAQQTTFRQTIFSVFAQDTWKVSSRVTLAYGLRWEPNLFQQDKFGRGSTFSLAAFQGNQHSAVFPNAPAGEFYFGDAGVPKSFTSNNLEDLSPRLGLTISPYADGRTVFRFGAAQMYDTPSLYTSQRLTSNAPFVDEIDLNGPVSFASPWSNYPGGDPFPGTFPPNSASTFPTNTLYVQLPRQLQIPVVYQWTASVQQDLGRSWSLSINYLGNENAHLLLGRGINPATYIPGVSTGINGSCGPLTTTTGLPAKGANCSSTSNTNSRTMLSLLNPAQGAYYNSGQVIVDDEATSSYNGLITTVQHRLSNFSFLANYTWSKCIDDGDSQGDIASNAYENPLNPRMDRARCGYDIRHIFNTTVVASSNFKSLHGPVGFVINGWQIAPLVRILSGAPLNITTGSDVSLNGQGLDRPNLVSPTTVYTHQMITQSASGNRFYFNKSAFAAQAPGTFGNLGRNTFNGPNYVDIDSSLVRSFPIHDRLALNLRLECFNILNHPFFSTFTTALNSGTFGYATATPADEQREFQAAARFTF